MKRYFFTSLLGIILLTSTNYINHAQSQNLPENVVNAINSRIEGANNVGIMIGIVDENGPRYYGFGQVSLDSDKVPDEHTVYEIGSISKVFTAILLADMVNKKELKLNDPIQKHLPEHVKIPGRNGKDIQLHHLSTHYSSLPRLPNNMNPANPANPYADYSVDMMYEFLTGHTLTRDIGSRFEYSNLAVGLLGHILALKNGTSYEDLLKDRIINVLDLNETSITLTTELKSRLAKPYSNGVEVENWDLPTLAGAGAIRSTAHDMLRFLSANMGVLESPIYKAMKLSHKPRESAQANTQIGLGWVIRDINDKKIIWHNGGTGGYRSFAGFIPEDKIGVVVMTNSTVGADDIGTHILDSSVPIQDIKPSAIAKTIASVDKELVIDKTVLLSYVGEYQLAPTFSIFIRHEDGALFAQATGQPEIEIFPMSKTKFYYKVVDAQITFIIDESGIVQSLTLHQNGRDIPGKRINN